MKQDPLDTIERVFEFPGHTRNRLIATQLPSDHKLFEPAGRGSNADSLKQYARTREGCPEFFRVVPEESIGLTLFNPHRQHTSICTGHYVVIYPTINKATE